MAGTGHAHLRDGDRVLAVDGTLQQNGELVTTHSDSLADAIGAYADDAVELRLVGPEPRCPSTAGGAAEPGLDPGFQVAGREVRVIVAVAGRGQAHDAATHPGRVEHPHRAVRSQGQLGSPGWLPANRPKPSSTPTLAGGFPPRCEPSFPPPIASARIELTPISLGAS